MAKTKVSEVSKAMGIPEYKPTLTLDKKLYPDLKNLKIDQVIDLNVKVKINSITRSQYNPSQPLHVSGTIENAQSEGSDDYDD